MTREKDERTRAWVALILACGVAIGVLSLTGAALYDSLVASEETKVTSAYVALIQTTLGVLVGGLVGYIGGTVHSNRGKDEKPKDEEPDE